eukprot:TRINITY_DN28328_c0_g1_i1.p1 TRINITY_DN28328_c0_g1~~TRINITY_DN28328_c0_g1_i1.p1  ORF type:complete len:539 (+),score=29.94 TRINITY_DN28328_c0_g1_i1:55-1671(+)
MASDVIVTYPGAPWGSHSICYAIGDNHRIYRQMIQEMPPGNKWEMCSKGDVKGIAIAGNIVYAVGLNNCVYKQYVLSMHTTSTWTRISGPGVVRICVDDSGSSTFVHGSGSTIYGVGVDGRIYKQDLPSMTTSSEWVLCSPSGPWIDICVGAKYPYQPCMWALGQDEAIYKLDIKHLGTDNESWYKLRAPAQGFRSIAFVENLVERIVGALDRDKPHLFAVGPHKTVVFSEAQNAMLSRKEWQVISGPSVICAAIVTREVTMDPSHNCISMAHNCTTRKTLMHTFNYLDLDRGVVENDMQVEWGESREERERNFAEGKGPRPGGWYHYRDNQGVRREMTQLLSEESRRRWGGQGTIKDVTYGNTLGEYMDSQLRSSLKKCVGSLLRGELWRLDRDLEHSCEMVELYFVGQNGAGDVLTLAEFGEDPERTHFFFEYFVNYPIVMTMTVDAGPMVGIMALFKQHDTDGDGSLSLEEIQKLFMAIRPSYFGKFGTDEWAQIFAVCDMNNDGKISIPELLKTLVGAELTETALKSLKPFTRL